MWLWCFGFVAGAGAVVGAYFFKSSFEREGLKAAWYDWVAAGLLYAYWVFVFYFVSVSCAELQAKAALVGFAVFGGVGVLLTAAYRLLTGRRPSTRGA